LVYTNDSLLQRFNETDLELNYSFIWVTYLLIKKTLQSIYYKKVNKIMQS